MVRWADGKRALREFHSLLKKVFEKADKYLTLRTVHRSNLTFVCTAPRWVIDVLKRMITMGERVLIRLGVIQVTIEGLSVFQGVSSFQSGSFSDIHCTSRNPITNGLII